MHILWLARHGHRLDFIQPEWFETATYPYDPPLSALGLEQAIELSQQLSHSSVEQIFTSPFLRTVQTAAPLARSLELPIQLEWGLCEWLCADWTLGLPEPNPMDDLRRDYPEIDSNYRSAVLPVYPETLDCLDLRIAIIARELVKSKSEQICAIAHKGSVLGIVATLTRDRSWLTYDLPCGGLLKLVRVGDSWVCESGDIPT